MASYKIHLNASNYVSPEREQAFQDALKDNHRVSGTAEDPPKAPPAAQSSAQPTAQPRASSGSSLLQSVSEGMTRFSEHQQRTMEIHEQYLRQQEQFASLFSEVLQHQESLLEQGDNGRAGPLVESLHRSLDSFHQLQERGLQVHQQFLEQTAVNSRSFVNLLERQHRLMENGAARHPGQALPGPAPQVQKGSGSESPQPLPVKPEPTPEPETSAPAPTAPPGAASIPLEELSGALLEIVAEKTGYPADMLELEMDMEADLGIDSIKRVEILGALEESYPELPQPDTEALAELRTLGEVVEYMDTGIPETPGPSETSRAAAETTPPGTEIDTAQPADDQPAAHPDLDGLTDLLLEVVAEKTGYPAEMLELEMDMEADLGIDSIKRVEILGAMEEQAPELPPFETETLAEMRTLEQIIEAMGQPRSSGAAEPQTSSGSKKKQPRPELSVDPVRTRHLPAPDHYDFSIPGDRPLVLTDEGSAFTGQLAGMLASSGWKVVLWHFPPDLIQPPSEDHPGRTPAISQTRTDPAALQEAWDELLERHGSPLGLLHLHPSTEGLEDFHPRDRELVKQVFSLAGLFDRDGKNPGQGERSLFMTVTREDGQLGISGARDHFHESSGFPGLIKTLRWEWPEVFCRSVDLDPGLNLEAMTAAVLAEMHDPDRGTIEVGVTRGGRITLEKEHSR